MGALTADGGGGDCVGGEGLLEFLEIVVEDGGGEEGDKFIKNY